MKTLTNDEKSLIVGAVMSAGVSGIGIYQLLQATLAPTLAGLTISVVTGAMLFNAGISGLTAVGAIWYNYQATL